jgi:hypothetical protein
VYPSSAILSPDAPVARRAFSSRTRRPVEAALPPGPLLETVHGFRAPAASRRVMTPTTCGPLAVGVTTGIVTASS